MPIGSLFKTLLRQPSLPASLHCIFRLAQPSLFYLEIKTCSQSQSALRVEIAESPTLAESNRHFRVALQSADKLEPTPPQNCPNGARIRPRNKRINFRFLDNRQAEWSVWCNWDMTDFDLQSKALKFYLWMFRWLNFSDSLIQIVVTLHQYSLRFFNIID